MADIDDFKHINDTYGHPCGDQVLRQVAVCLMANVRSIDILGRYGGDEFVILLPESDLLTASEVAERLANRVRELRIPYNDKILQTSLSIGVTLVTQLTHNLEALFAQADQSLYKAKQRGKDCVEIG
jgi:diguanylate cyclase (GGDEF)-like protein